MLDYVKKFITKTLHYDSMLASWFYLMGVKPDQFGPVFDCPEHDRIDRIVPAYSRYAAQLRDILLELNCDDTHAYIAIPHDATDNSLYGYLVRPTEQKYLQISYNGVDGIQISNGEQLLLGGIPPVNICPELAGNWRHIDKSMLDMLFQYAANTNPVKNPSRVFHRVVKNPLDNGGDMLFLEASIRTSIHKYGLYGALLDLRFAQCPDDEIVRIANTHFINTPFPTLYRPIIE